MTLVFRILVCHAIFKDKRWGFGVYNIISDRCSHASPFSPVSLLSLPSSPAFPRGPSPSTRSPSRVLPAGASTGLLHPHSSISTTRKLSTDLWGKEESEHGWDPLSHAGRGKKKHLDNRSPQPEWKRCPEAVVQKAPPNRAGWYRSPVEPATAEMSALLTPWAGATEVKRGRSQPVGSHRDGLSSVYKWM